jgi:hypothetical protein
MKCKKSKEKEEAKGREAAGLEREKKESHGSLCSACRCCVIFFSLQETNGRMGRQLLCTHHAICPKQSKNLHHQMPPLTALNKKL